MNLQATRTKSTGFTLIEILTVIVILGILAAIALPAIQAARDASRRAQCASRLRQVGVALANYHSAHNVLPPAKINSGSYGPNPASRRMPVLGGGTKNTTGWVLLLPVLGEQTLFDAYNHDLCSSANAAASGPFMPVAGSDAVNSTVVGALVNVLNCPADGRPIAVTNNPDTPTDPFSVRNGRQSSYLFSTGGHGDGSPVYNILNGSALQGMFGSNGSANWEMVEDGLSRTIAVGEASRTQAADAAGVYWGAGAAGCCHGTSEPFAFSSGHDTGGHFLFGEGSVQFFSWETERRIFVMLSTIHGEEDASEL